MKTMEWVEYVARYGPNSLLLKLGRITLGNVTWRSPNKYAAVCHLPSIKNKGYLGEFKTEQEAKDKLHTSVSNWFKEGGIS